MANPVVGKVEFQNSSKQAILIIDPDSSYVQVTYKSGVGFTIMELTNTGNFSLLENVILDGTRGSAILGGKPKKATPTNGSLVLRDAQAQDVITLDASLGNVYVGGAGKDGDLLLYPSSGVANYLSADGASIHMSANEADVRVGGSGQNGTITVQDASGDRKVIIEGSSGDILLENGDCAEDFDLAETEKAEPGAIMVIDDESKLRQSTQAYDRRVAGVVSGAGDYRPALILDHKPCTQARVALAIMGKVFCKVDAGHGAIGVGDLLTTSPTPGHAMRADDPLKAFGAVIGKALRPLKEGNGMIPILVALQ